MFKSLIKGGLSIDIEKHPGVLEHALSKVDFLVGVGMYMLPSNLNLATGKKEGYNNKMLVSNTDMKTGLNRHINKDRKKMPVSTTDVPKKIVIPAVQHDPPYNLRILTENHNDEKLAMTISIKGVG